jgi:hypothetical protein
VLVHFHVGKPDSSADATIVKSMRWPRNGAFAAEESENSIATSKISADVMSWSNPASSADAGQRFASR